MLFNSYEFIFFFLPFSFFIYFYLNHRRLLEASKGFLVFSSLVFYSWWNIAYLPLILSSMLFNYVMGNALIQEPTKGRHKFSKKTLLAFGIIANLSLLAYFKYSDFFIENFNFVFKANVELLHLALPLAISFFTFQQIAYLVDSYRRETQEYDFLNYAVFVTFFPQLIAGPIVHHKEMMPQFETVRNKVINYKNIAMGLFVFSIGLFKKVVIADTFATWATSGFDVAETLNLFEAWITSLSYTFQLYFDFSGYTDMAIGAALLFNIRLPINFNSPYKALNIQDFWRRWHMTLSRFLRDYIYIPLGGNRRGSFRTYNNLLATFVLGGIWHGAGWTFVFWGLLHGMALVIHRFWSNIGVKMPKWLAWLITFNFINIAWVFFRAKEFDDALKVLGCMFSLDNVVLPYGLHSSLAFLQNFGVEFGKFIHIDGRGKAMAFIVLAFIIVLRFKNSMEKLETLEYNKKTALLSSAMFLSALLLFNQVSEFLYFNF
ncbi:MAG: MBOAT family protein [Campylobacterota bacterium]|nr:MBOAT family protein [Campylobacterota bacterium]